ncbi:unnamed protein product [Sphenostylis stenocarpa]|uniref:Uncharacterized protein n=1 Tax=Sphenostylis stenocarpa TaxID=92480 RepID=A0AA86VU57_9FABA|nr:unnamed protein product [Sphenostylis stenocarpa]
MSARVSGFNLEKEREENRPRVVEGHLFEPDTKWDELIMQAFIQKITQFSFPARIKHVFMKACVIRNKNKTYLSSLVNMHLPL